MKRITKHEDSLNVVREKCESRQTDFNAEELKHLSLVHIELQKSYGKKFVKPLDKSCGYCVITAMNCIHNYIIHEENKGLKVLIHNNISSDGTKSSQDDDFVFPHDLDNQEKLNQEETNEYEELAKLSLKELRLKFPNIKARSIDKFIELLKEQ